MSLLTTFLDKANLWVTRLVGYPGIDDNNLTLRKDYWLSSLACFVVILSISIAVWIFHPELKILLLYGLFLIALFLEFILAGIFIRRNLEWLMFFNQSLLIFGTLITILMLGGIPSSGGLIFVGLFVVLFSLDFKKRGKSVTLFIFYAISVIVAGLLHPLLVVPPEMTPSVNITLFVINLLWISAFAFMFVLSFISQRVEIEQNETMRLRELDEVKTRLYTNITHEFRTPLTVILGAADLLSTSKAREVRERAEQIGNNGRMLLHLVTQMLDLAKLEAGAMPVKMVQADVIQYIRYIIELFRSAADSKKVTLEFRPEQELLVIDFDPEKLMQIISNLVSNALKYTQTGGVVTIITTKTGSVEQHFRIIVRDTGSGISPEHLPHIFDRYYRVEKSVSNHPGGSGLGLALTHELIKRLNGRIRAESVPGTGTEFIVSLPITHRGPLDAITELTDLTAEAKVYHTPQLAGTGTTIRKRGFKNNRPILLIVEDNLDVTNYLTTLLDIKYTIHTAVNGKEGLQQAFELIPDLIITDIMMPEMDGVELLDKVKNDIRTSHIPVVILTAKADITSRLDGLERGADVYLAKPFNQKELVVQLGKLVKLRKKLEERYATIGILPASTNDEFKLEDSFMQKVQEIVLENIDNEMFTVNTLCKAVAMSRAQLYRKFRSLTNKTVNEYILSLRLSKARELLMGSDINVSEAAIRTGFKNLSHFSRVFTENSV